jgi:hypothetical protein
MSDMNSELILHRLDEIAKKQDELSNKFEELNIQMTKLKTIEHSVDNIKEWKEHFQADISVAELKDLKEWKAKMEEHQSTSQLEKHLEEHEALKTFKTQAMMIFAVVQALMGLIVFWKELFT